MSTKVFCVHNFAYFTRLVIDRKCFTVKVKRNERTGRLGIKITQVRNVKITQVRKVKITQVRNVKITQVRNVAITQLRYVKITQVRDTGRYKMNLLRVIHRV